MEGHMVADTSLTYDIPWTILHHVAKHGLAQHLPLTYLTDKAIKRSAHIGDGDEVINLDRESLTLRASSKPLSAEGEDQLSYTEWKQAIRRYLLLIKKFLPRWHEKWVQHMLSIEEAPDALSKNWQLWLLYDIEVCKRSNFEPLDPATFQMHIYKRVQSNWLIRKVSKDACVEARTAALGAVSAMTGAPLGLKAQPRLTSYTPPSITNNKKLPAKSPGCSFCLCCGRSSHRMDECTDTTRLDNGPMFITNKSMDPRTAYRDRDGKPVCLRWNSRSACKPKVGESCTYCHVCTLDGRDHHTADCPLLGPHPGSDN
jgi:hypothetical protein